MKDQTATFIQYYCYATFSRNKKEIDRLRRETLAILRRHMRFMKQEGKIDVPGKIAYDTGPVIFDLQVNKMGLGLEVVIDDFRLGEGVSKSDMRKLFKNSS